MRKSIQSEFSLKSFHIRASTETSKPSTNLLFEIGVKHGKNLEYIFELIGMLSEKLNFELFYSKDLPLLSFLIPTVCLAIDRNALKKVKCTFSCR